MVVLNFYTIQEQLWIYILFNAHDKLIHLLFHYRESYTELRREQVARPPHYSLEELLLTCDVRSGTHIKVQLTRTLQSLQENELYLKIKIVALDTKIYEFVFS